MTVKHRIRALECRLIEAEIARLDRYYETVSDSQIDLICTITEDLQAGVMGREYSPEEVEFYNRHVAVINGFSITVQVERDRRIAAELVTTGKASKAEIDEILKRYIDA